MVFFLDSADRNMRFQSLPYRTIFYYNTAHSALVSYLPPLVWFRLELKTIKH